MIALLLLLAATPAQRDAAGSDRYLEPSAVVAGLAGRGGLLAACGDGHEDGAWPLDLRILPSGRIELRAAPASLRDCLARVLAGAPMPPHDEEPLTVSATVLVREGRASLGPVIETPPLRVHSLFLYVPPDLDAKARSTLHDTLGVVPSESVAEQEE